MHLKQRLGVWEVASWLSISLYKYEDPSSDLQLPYKRGGPSTHTSNPSTRQSETRGGFWGVLVSKSS